MKLCKHFGDCGGCSYQDIPYKEQLIHKLDKVKNLMSACDIKTDIKPINPSEEWYYRNKMEFSFSSNGNILCGLYSKLKKGKLVDIEECLIFSPDTGLILDTVKKFSKERSYEVYNKYSHKGFLRYLILRQTKFTNETMVGITVSSQNSFDKEGFIKVLAPLKLKSAIKSIYLITSDSLSDAVVFEEKELLYGEAWILEKLGDMAFKISIDTFSQVNPKATVGFYNKIKEYADLDDSKSVLDLFCGAGSIGLYLSKQAKFVWGVEVSSEIIDMAWENAKINNTENISFFVADVRKFLNTQGTFYKNTDLVVINPPRSGLSNKIIRAVMRLNPKKIIYSSCNVDALFRDLKGLTDAYQVNFIEPFDFFPHTRHLECLALFSKMKTFSEKH
ncbi:MAG: 23S rRNA (uracil(1939)-C(5))-methyltransferase RlmD [Candidatus Omnitrophota bacterium]